MNQFPPSLPHHVETPHSEDELRALILEATRSERVLRVVGSGHSVPNAIAAGKDMLVSLENMRSVSFDEKHGRIEVEAGITLGPCPKWPHRPPAETLGGYLEQRALSSCRAHPG